MCFLELQGFSKHLFKHDKFFRGVSICFFTDLAGFGDRDVHAIDGH